MEKRNVIEPKRTPQFEKSAEVDTFDKEAVELFKAEQHVRKQSHARLKRKE